MAIKSKVKPQVTKAQLRSFGLIVGGVFLFIGLWPAVRRGADIRTWAVVVAAVLIVPSLIIPTALRPVYTVWMAVGEVLGRINTKIILGLAFYIVVTPIGLVLRLMGHDPMRRRFEPKAASYRVTKEPRPASHLKKPF
jgi:hypothetical protein